MGHDLMAYGQAHVIAMLGFQGTAFESRDFIRKLIASVAMLGGAALLPVLCWCRIRSASLGLATGLALGIAGAQLSGHSGSAFWTTLAFSSAGGASLGGALFHRWKDQETRWMATWALLGLTFLLALRFTASRYWIPFFPALVLLSLQGVHARWAQAATLLTLTLSLGLAADDHDLAMVQRDMAVQLSEMDEERARYAGHWGLQYHLMGTDWRQLEEDSPVPDGRLLAVSAISWPQAPAPGCFQLVQCIAASPLPYLPRVHAPEAGANFHAHLASGPPGRPGNPCEITQGWDLQPVETYAPRTFSTEPQEVMTLWRSCGSE